MRKFFSLASLRSWTLNIAIILGIYFAIQFYQSMDAPSSGEAPVVHGVLLNGDTVTLSELKGQPVLVYFWATWCRVCQFSKNNIEAIAQDHAVLTIASQSGGWREVEKYVEEHAVTAPVLVDETNYFSERFGVRAFPTVFIIDAQGNIDDVEVGYSTEWGLRFRLWKAAWM